MQAYEQLEKSWSEFNDLDPAGMVACASGTAALHLALEAFQLPPGSEVITSDFNMIAVPRAISAAGLTPVFVDCDERLLMDLSSMWNAMSKLCEAMIAVHIYGRSLDMEKFNRWAKPGGPGKCPSSLLVVEDLAEAHGVKPHPQTDAACWSFYKNKIVAGEEGGAVWFRDPKHAEVARELRCLGFTKTHNFYHRPRGWNHRMSNLHAEDILHGPRGLTAYEAEQRGFPIDRSTRRQIEAWYDSLCPDEWKMPPRDAPWVYDLKLPLAPEKLLEREMRRVGIPVESVKRVSPYFKEASGPYGIVDVVVDRLRANGIEARHSFKPMHLQEEYRNCRCVHSCDVWSVATEMSGRVMYLPIQPGKTTRVDCKIAFDWIQHLLK